MAADAVDTSMAEDVQPRPPPLEPMEQQEPAGLDHQFGNMLCKLMDGQMTAADAVRELHQYSAAVVQYYRAEEADELQDSVHRINISRLASELEAQAASWQLLQALYCMGAMPAGVYGSAANVGNRLTMAQLLADTVNGDDDLRRFAQVVMWLEALAAQKLPDPLRDASCRFTSQDGVWRETLRALGGPGHHTAAGPGSELDPDAVSRDQLKLAVANQENDKKLAAWAWRLVRAGRFQDACELCRKTGQAWRAVSLAGGGPWGPLPVGPAAAAASQGDEQQDPLDELACEVEGGAASARLAWRWACYAAAAAAGPSEDGEGGSKYEAALYGALCGDVARMLPACDTWEDEAWAYCRAWLELQTDAHLLQDCGANSNSDMQTQAGAQEFFLGASGDSNDGLEVPQDVLEGFVDLAAVSDYSRRPSKQLLKEGLAVLKGDWPMLRLGVSGNQQCLPSSFKELYDLLSSSSNSRVSSAAQHSQHVLQLHLMSEEWVSLVLQLKATSAAAAQQLQRQQQALKELAQGASRAAAAGASEDGDVVMEADGGGYGAEGFDGGQGQSCEAAVDVLRFNAHMALVLRALGLIPDPLTAPDDTDTLPMLQQVLSQVIFRYASHLAGGADSLRLVPAYLCHLRLPERRALSTQLLQTALDTGMDEEEAEFLYTLLSAGTEFWYERQCRQQEEGSSPDNMLFGDLRPEEARLLLQHNVYQAFSDAATSPKQRCDTLRWMIYSFTTAARAAAADAGSDPPPQLTWQGTWADALSNSLGLATQLVLNPGCGGPSLAYLLEGVIPQEFPAAAATAAAAAAGAEGDAAGLSSAVSSAAGVDVVQAVGQLQVQRQLLALTFWQHYAGLEARYQAWKEWRASLLPAAAATEQQGYTLEQSVVLVQDMLQLAQADPLTLPAPEWLCQLLNGMASSTARAERGDSVEHTGVPAGGVREGDWLCLPQFDAPVNPLLLQAYAEGSVEQVLGLLPHHELQLAVTVSRHQPGQTGSEAAAEAADMELPYRRLEAHEVPVLQARVEAFLQAATAAHPDVAWVTGQPPDDEPMAGCLLIKLTAYTRDDSGSSGSSGVLDSRELAAWQALVSVAVGLMDAGSKVVGDGGEEGGGDDDEGVSGGVPRLCVVYLNSSLSTQLAISRRRTTSKLIRRSAKVLRVLARQGYRGPEVDTLLRLAADGDDSQGLMAQLSQADAAQLMDCMVAALADMQDGV